MADVPSSRLMFGISIFDRDSFANPLPWLQEKTLRALEEAARLVDLVNEPDTTTWYAKTLKERAERLVVRIAPVMVLVHEAKGRWFESSHARQDHGPSRREQPLRLGPVSFSRSVARENRRTTPLLVSDGGVA